MDCKLQERLSDLRKPPARQKAGSGALCGLLLTVHLAIALGLAALFQAHKVTVANWCFTLLVGSQLCLVGLCGGLAWRRETWRAMSCFVGMALGSVWVWSIVLTATQNWHRDRVRWFAARLCLTVIVTTFVATAAMRWRWFELVRYPDARPTPGVRPFQFSLRQLMLVVSATSLSLGVGRALHQLCTPTSDEHVVAILYSVFMWLFSMTALLGVLVPERLGMKWLCVPLIVFGLASLLNFVTHSHQSLAFAMFVDGSSVITVVTILAFRRAGYRLVRKEPSAVWRPARKTNIRRRHADDRDSGFAQWLAAQAESETSAA